MIDAAHAPGTIKSAMLALRLAVQQERNVAAIVLQDESRTPPFEGNGASDPNLGKVVDISV